MSIPHLEALEALDWQQIQCQTDIHRCRNKAVYAIERHAADDCIYDDTLNADGNRVELLCQPCYRELQRAIRRYLKRIDAVRGRCACLTCGAPLLVIENIIRGRKKL